MSKNTLILKNTHVLHILSNYYEDSFERVPETVLEIKKDIDIGDLVKEKSSRYIYFLDTHKQKIKYWVNMLDVTQGFALPLRTSKPCWWHRGQIKTRPLGIPIQYSSNKTEGLDKDRIKERFRELNYSSESNDFFITEGLVCSFPCMKAYILDQLSRSKSSRFKESLTLMSLLYSKIFGKLITIPTAPSWKVLRDYGGHLTEEEYLETFGRLVYTETVNLRRPYMFSSSSYIQETRVRV